MVENEYPEIFATAAIKHIQAALLIKRDPDHRSEHLPRVAVLDTDAVDLLEIGLNPPISVH